MKKTVLLLGGSGMLGFMLLEIFSKEKNIELSCTLRSEKIIHNFKKKYPHVKFLLFDVQKNSLNYIVQKKRSFDWIVNAIGIIKPFIHEDNEQDREHALVVNAEFPYQLSKAIKKRKTKVLQIATDCVFSGTKGTYTEENVHDPIDVYGMTKSLGEIPSEQFYHLRCSIIGPEAGIKKSLLEWFLGQKKEAHVSGYTNHYWNGITTYHFAKICVGIISTRTTNNLNHLQHVIPSNKINKAELLSLFSQEFKRDDIVISKKNVDEAVDRTLSTIHGTINKQLWENAGYSKVPSIQKMVSELSNYMKGNV